MQFKTFILTDIPSKSVNIYDMFSSGLKLFVHSFSPNDQPEKNSFLKKCPALRKFYFLLPYHCVRMLMRV